MWKPKKLGEAEIKIPYNDRNISASGYTNSRHIKIRRIDIDWCMAVQYMVNRKDEVEMLTDLKKLPCGVVWSGWI